MLAFNHIGKRDGITVINRKKRNLNTFNFNFAHQVNGLSRNAVSYKNITYALII